MTSSGPRVVGAEGLYAREIALQNKQRALGWRLLGILFFPAAPYCWRKARALSTSTGQASVGADAEANVVAALKTNPDVAVVLSGLNLNPRSGEDVDQTVLLKSGAVAVVEVKRRMGWAAVEDDRLVTGKAKKPWPEGKDPLEQVTRGAGHVARALGDLPVGPVHRIVCIDQAPNKQVLDYIDEPGRAPIRICSAKTLATALADLVPTVAAEQTRTAERALKAAHRRKGR